MGRLAAVLHDFRFLSRCLVAVVLTAFAACLPGEERPNAVVSDSAGVRIIESTGPTWDEGEQWRLSETPLLNIGVAQGDPNYELYRVAAALRLTDGRIVVANSGTSELRFYDPAGHFLHSAGRDGGGPGEFESLGRIYEFAPGSLMVADRSLYRMSVFDTEGKFVRSWTAAGDGRSFQPLGCFSDGSVLMAAGVGMPGAGQPGVVRDTVSYYRYAADGSVLDTLGMFPDAERYFSSRDDVITVVFRPFGRHARTAVADDVFYIGTGEKFEIAVHSSDGALVKILRFGRQLTRLTDDHIQQYKSRQAESFLRYLEGVQFPPTLPAYSRFVVDAAGNLWAREYLPPAADHGSWWVFDKGGVLLGSIDVPAAFDIRQVGDDYVLGAWRDEDGVEHVQSFELIKASQG